MSEITTTKLTKRYEDVTAVDEIDLEIDDGEFVVIVGPSGCGKSTTLRMLAGLETPTEGDIFIGEKRVNDVEPKDRGIAMVFQNYGLYPHMTARENMTFGTKTAVDFSVEEVSERVKEAAEILDISDLLDRVPGELSGGEQQRVAIGRALVRDPDVFLMDEPLSNLDAKLRIQMRAELGELQNELGTTTIYVTHDQTEAMTLGDRVVVLNGGEIEQIDPPQRLYDYPETEFVASFIGSPAMNTFPVELEAEDGLTVAKRGQMQFRLPHSEGLTHLDGNTALLGIRPDDLSIVNTGDEHYSFEIDVVVTESLGDSLLIYGNADGTELNVQVEPRLSINAGDTLEITYDPERLHIFDDESGDCLYHSGEKDAALQQEM